MPDTLSITPILNSGDKADGTNPQNIAMLSYQCQRAEVTLSFPHRFRRETRVTVSICNRNTDWKIENKTSIKNEML